MRRSWLTGLGGALALLAGGCGLLLGFPVRTVLLGVAAVLGGALAVTSGGRAIRHARLTRRLARISRPGRLADTPVRSVPGVGPMVAGLVRPAVYCDEDLAARLDPGQQQAVLLHERCHQQRHDPVRIVVLDAIDTLLGRLRPVRRRVEAARTALEIRADVYALDHGATRSELAGALLALSSPQPAGTAAFGAVTQERLAALLDGAPVRRDRRRRTTVAALALTTVGAFLACAPILSASHSELMLAARCLPGGCGSGG